MGIKRQLSSYFDERRGGTDPCGDIALDEHLVRARRSSSSNGHAPGRSTRNPVSTLTTIRSLHTYERLVGAWALSGASSACRAPHCSTHPPNGVVGDVRRRGPCPKSCGRWCGRGRAPARCPRSASRSISTMSTPMPITRCGWQASRVLRIVAPVAPMGGDQHLFRGGVVNL